MSCSNLSRFHRWLRRICLAAALIPGGFAFAADENAAVAAAQEGPPPLVRPAYGAVRYGEDWSVLRGRDFATTGDMWDPIKYVPLTEDGWLWASFGGQWRARLESWNNFNFGGVPAGSDENDTLLLNRLLYHADLHFGPNVRVFIEGKSAFGYDHELPPAREPLDIDELALQNGFIDVRVPSDTTSVIFRAGRQELLFGKQRLVSPLDWANTRRTFDGFSAMVKAGDWTVTPFFTNPVMVDKYGWNESDGNVKFYGVYGTGKVPTTPIGMDLYWLALERPTATFNGTSGEEDRHTLGGRLIGTIGKTGFDYDFEGAYQFGELGSGDISAFMIGSEFGYTGDMAGKPRFFLGFDYGSGDDSPGGDVGTFNQLFPLGHAYLGWIDIIGRQSIIDVTPGVTFTPIEKTTVTIQGHFFWRADDSDALYNAGGGVVRAGGLSDEREVGTEIDLLIKHRSTPAWRGSSATATSSPVTSSTNPAPRPTRTSTSSTQLFSTPSERRITGLHQPRNMLAAIPLAHPHEQLRVHALQPPDPDEGGQSLGLAAGNGHRHVAARRDNSCMLMGCTFPPPTVPHQGKQGKGGQTDTNSRRCGHHGGAGDDIEAIHFGL